MIPMNGRKVSGRELRRQLNGETAWLQGQVVPAINTALQNGQAVQARVDALEPKVAGVEALLARRFWGRLSWVVTGR